jgi:hypothetical protein
MDQQQLLGRLDKAWVAFKNSYAGLSESDILEPGVTKAWSVRDIIAHVTTWEEEALKHLPAILEGRRPPLYSVTYGGIDAFNALMTTKKAGLSLAEVYRERDEIYRQVIDTVVRTPDAHVACETGYRRRLRLDTYGHYPKHTEAIGRWRTQRQAGTCVQTPGPRRDTARVAVRLAQILETLESRVLLAE